MALWERLHFTTSQYVYTIFGMEGPHLMGSFLEMISRYLQNESRPRWDLWPPHPWQSNLTGRFIWHQPKDFDNVQISLKYQISRMTLTRCAQRSKHSRRRRRSPCLSCSGFPRIASMRKKYYRVEGGNKFLPRVGVNPWRQKSVE